MARTVGGKAAGLEWLLERGFSVPPFGVLSVEDCVEALGLHDAARSSDGGSSPAVALLAEWIDELEFASEGEARDILSASIRSAILDLSVSEEVVARACDRLDLTMPVAIRSSAACEDMVETSSAGQFETLIGRFELNEVVDGLKYVIASYYSPRAIQYRSARGISQAGPRMAAVIQQAVEPRASGIAFTCNPTNSDQDVVLIESTHGFGQPVVAGEIQPDRIVVNKKTMTILERRAGTKAVVCLLRDGRCVTEDSGAEGEAMSVSAVEAMLIAEVSCSIESLAGAPQDIEWAIGRDAQLYVIQRRPITALRRGYS
jgi:pyruvate,water dikinase